jgi:prepilin-type N-terminal cleavage/methylation domain-containing protein
MRKTTDGFSLLECLVALAITGLVTLISAQLVARLTHVFASRLTQLEQRAVATKTAFILTGVVATSERSHIPELLTITSGSSLILPHGGKHPVAGLSGTSMPRSESDIISAIEVDPRYRARVASSSFSGTDGARIEACELASRFTTSRFRSYLALGPQGLCQFTGDAQATGTGCVTLDARALSGLIRNTPCPRASLLELLPVEREFSVFVDRAGQLRLVSHVGMRIIENQPMARGLRSTTLSTFSDPTGAVFYDLLVTPTSSRSTRFILEAHLARRELFNEMLL